MIDMAKELNDVQKYIWETRAFIGRDLFGKATNHITPCAIACHTIARFSNHLSLDQLKRLKDLSEQCMNILRFLDEQ